MKTHNTLKCVLPMQTNSSSLLGVIGLMGWISDILDNVYATEKFTGRHQFEQFPRIIC